jgi:hypothetical protein
LASNRLLRYKVEIAKLC